MCRPHRIENIHWFHFPWGSQCFCTVFGKQSSFFGIRYGCLKLPNKFGGSYYACPNKADDTSKCLNLTSIDRIHLNCNIFTQLLTDPQFFINRFSDIEQQLLLFPEDATENCKCCQFRLKCLIGWWVRKVVMFVHNNGYFVHYCASSSNCNIIPSSVYSHI